MGRQSNRSALLCFGLAAGFVVALFGVWDAVPLLESLRWPWYATVISAAVAAAMLLIWERR